MCWRGMRHGGGMSRLGAATLVVALLAAGATRAAAPPDADPALAPWFRSLNAPDTGLSCCALSDCRPVDYRVRSDVYEAFIDGEWRPVPPEKILRRSDNPTGRAIACWTRTVGIMCFLPGPGT